MVGIFKYNCGLQFVAVSENEETAIQALFNKYASEWDKQYMTPRRWWERNKALNNGAPRCFEIKPIQVV